MKINQMLFVGLLLVLTACSATKKAKEVYTPAPDAIPLEDEILTEHRQLDTMVISAPRLTDEEEQENVPEVFVLDKYNPSHKRLNDLIHTKLELKFDWAKEQVLGKATLELEPYFYPINKVTLDAKNFEFHQVRFLGENKNLKYEYDDQQIVIDLGKIYKKGEKYELFIDYTASPAETGGSAAITSDQGLFFINPRGEEDKPMQIWTQGETEWNSKWFPTIDKPNERCTQEMYITVEDRFKTLSNGTLVNSTPNSDGTRTDYWKMPQPHAPYLFMIAVGEFAVVQDKWEGIPVDYYVEPEYEDDARAIFAHTPEMMEFFSEKLKIDYPWPKYSQIVVRDYVSGAMENTTASIFGDFVQKHKEELVDDNNDRIVAHELFHHWFGDYVTCESWANLTMNEGFANYSEYLWFEHKYGIDEADYHLFNEQSGYLSSTQGNNVHPLIYHGYEDKEDMFDAHSYNKGGAVLHMLRNYIGDEAFWAGLTKYLKDNAFQAVEVHDLRLAYESVTGEDLNWFFEQWYMSEGHPQMNIEYGYDADRKMTTVKVSQVQDPKVMPAIFKMPVNIDIYTEDQKEPIREMVWVDEREETFEFPTSTQPKLVSFDADRMLLAEVTDNKSEEEYEFQFTNSKKFRDRFDAISALRESENGIKTLKTALKDDYWVIRAVALQSIQEFNEEDLPILRDLAENDEKAYIRAFALGQLADKQDAGVTEVAKKGLNDVSNSVKAAALYALFQNDKATALKEAERFNNTESAEIQELLSVLYSESGDTKYLNYFEEKLEQQEGFGAYYFYRSYQNLAKEGDFQTAFNAMEKLKAIASNMNTPSLNRLYASVSINEMRNFYRTKANESKDEDEKLKLEAEVSNYTKMLEEIEAQETNEELQQTYKTRLTLTEKEE